jgi:hypothetical protein
VVPIASTLVADRDSILIVAAECLTERDVQTRGGEHVLLVARSGFRLKWFHTACCKGIQHEFPYRSP